MMLRKILIILIISYSQIFSQDSNELVKITGDSLVGKVVLGNNIREVIGNVVMTQGDVRITCDKAIQFIARNEVELIGNVVATQDTIIIKTDSAFYSGRLKYALSHSGVELNDGQADLTAKNGYYYFNQKKAYFYENVVLIDSSNKLESQKLTYYDITDKAEAWENVRITDSLSSIEADSLIHYREIKTTIAYRNVKITNNNSTIIGEKLEDFSKNNITKISGKPVLFQIDTTDSGVIDTLIIAADYMEAIKGKNERLIAKDSVKIIRGNFSAVNDYSIYYRNDKKLFTYKLNEDKKSPVIWYDNTQLVGDSIFVYLNENELGWINIISDALILSENDAEKFRYDQVSGNNIKLFFNDSKLSRTEVNGNILSIYYLLEDNKPNGLIKSSAQDAKLYFTNNLVSNVKLYGSPETEYHPEPVIIDKEKEFTLPTFILYNNRPNKKELEQKIVNR